MAARDWIASSPGRIRAAWHCWHAIFLSETDAAAEAGRWPRFTEPPAALFYAAVLLAGSGVTARAHVDRGIPPETTQATLRDLELWIEDHRSKTGIPGFREIGWLRLHFRGRLHQIGRLQFEIKDSEHPFRVLRQRRTSAIIVLAEAGLQFGPDGLFADAMGSTAGPDALSTRLEEDSESVTGFPVSRTGRLESAPVALRRDEWECVLERGDPVLGVHIPAAGRFHGPMDAESCEQSFREAVVFYGRFFPEHRFRGFTCTSWLLDGQFPQYLPPQSNIVLFQKRFHLIPVPGASDSQAMERVFGSRVSDWTRAPRDTSLRRAIIDHIVAGGCLRSGGGFRPQH